MKDNPKLILIISLFVLAFYTQTAFSEGINSNELIKNARHYDGTLVVYSGEVVGDVMTRGRFAWANINDGDNAIGIWMSAGLAKEISLAGTYKSRGDSIEVSGIFHRACLEHGGDLDIHAQAIRKVAGGRIINQRLNIDKKNLSLILLGGIIFNMDIDLIQKNLENDLAGVVSLQALEEVRVKYLGRKGLVAELTGSIPCLPIEQRAALGRGVNALKNKLLNFLKEKENALKTKDSVLRKK